MKHQDILTQGEIEIVISLISKINPDIHAHYGMGKSNILYDELIRFC